MGGSGCTSSDAAAGSTAVAGERAASVVMGGRCSTRTGQPRARQAFDFGRPRPAGAACDRRTCLNRAWFCFTRSLRAFSLLLASSPPEAPLRLPLSLRLANFRAPFSLPLNMVNVRRASAPAGTTAPCAPPPGPTAGPGGVPTNAPAPGNFVRARARTGREC